MWPADTPIQISANEFAIAAIAVHDIEFCDMIAVQLIIKTKVSDFFTVRRNNRAIVGAVSIR